MMKTIFLLIMMLSLSACAVVHQSDGGSVYGVFSGGLFDAGGLIFK